LDIIGRFRRNYPDKPHGEFRRADEWIAKRQ
jgi:hypothetical protein